MLFRQTFGRPYVLACLPKVRALQAGTGKLPRAWVVSRAKFLNLFRYLHHPLPYNWVQALLAVAGASQQAGVLRQLIEWAGLLVPAIRMPTKSQKADRQTLKPEKCLWAFVSHTLHESLTCCWSTSPARYGGTHGWVPLWTTETCSRGSHASGQFHTRES